MLLHAKVDVSHIQRDDSLCVKSYIRVFSCSDIAATGNSNLRRKVKMYYSRQGISCFYILWILLAAIPMPFTLNNLIPKLMIVCVRVCMYVCMS